MRERLQAGNRVSVANVFLYAPQSFHNVCLLARSLEYFGQRDCFVFDPHQLVREHYGKYRRRELRVVSRGAFESIHWIRVDDPTSFLASVPGRIVATVADPLAAPLASFRFRATDLVLFGSERNGLGADVVAASAASVTIPTRGHVQSLNLSVAASIVLYELQRQMAASSASFELG